ncbi:MAG TPA: vWA domain-containing protein, partial [Polyangiales bacterium]|nr:vWA domain-containing protein [Polyangiales bacterium]
MSFETPEWSLLGLPLLALWALWLRRDPRTRWLRLASLLLAVIALTGPRLSTRAPGATWVVLVDRSASVHGQAGERARALLPELDRAARESHGSLYVIGVGRGAALLAAPGDGFESLQRIAEQDDSDLAAGLELAASYVPPHGAGEIVLISDGLYTAEDPRLSAAPLRARGIRVHVLPVGEVAGRDSAITRVLTPARATRGQRFAVAVEVQSPRAQPGRILLRDGGGR